MKYFVCTLGFFFLASQAFAAESAHGPQKSEDKIVSITLDEVKKMMAGRLTIDDVEKRLGAAYWDTVNSAYLSNTGSLMYKLPNEKRLTFEVKGPLITHAKYDNIEIKGIERKSLHMQAFGDTVRLDSLIFKDIESLKEHVKKLPQDTIIEWQHSDVIDSKTIKMEKELKSFADYCRKISIILIHRMPG
jgi:hypothetical protein